MNKIKKEYIPTIIFILTTTVFFFCLVPKWYIEKKTINNVVEFKKYTINWEEKYPFLEEEENKIVSKGINFIVPTMNNYSNTIRKIEENANFVISKGIVGKERFSELFCRLQKILGVKYVRGEDSSVLVLDNDNYTFQFQSDNSLGAKSVADGMTDFQEWLSGQGIEYLYIMEPYKISPVDDLNMYEGYYDYQKKNGEVLSECLNESKVNFLNLQEEALKETDDISDFFWRTDHHWTPEAALWSCGVVADTLNKNYGFSIDTDKYNESQYKKLDYGNRFLGSQGRKVTLGYAEPEKFELLLPSYPHNLHVEIPSLGICEDGTLYDTLINKSQLCELKYPYIYYKLNENAAYGYGDQAVVSVYNSEVKDNKKVLILKDSYVDSFGPFFSLGVKEVVWIDPRCFTGSIRSYIKEYKPDIVITMQNSGNVKLVENENHTELLDYR